MEDRKITKAMKKLILLICSLFTISVSSDINKDSVKRKVLSGLIISSWASAGITEGLKWKQNNGDGDHLIWKEDYHLYRAVTNINFVTIPILALTMEPSKENFKAVLISNIAGWALYETLISCVMYGDIDGSNEDFKILGARYPKPTPITSIAIATTLSIGIYYTF